MATRLKDLAEKVSDLFWIDPHKLIAHAGWNVRLPGPDLDAHINQLAESIRAVGLKKPLTVRQTDDGIEITDGFCRHAAVMRLLSEGEEIKAVPCMPEPRHTNEADHVLSMLTCNSGKPLSLLETAEVYRRLLGYGWEVRQIASKAGVNPATVERSLSLLQAPPEIQQMVAKGEVSATTAIKVVKEKGKGAAAALEQAQERAKAGGATKVRPRHLDDPRPTQRRADASDVMQAAWDRMGTAPDPRNPGWFVCNTLEADQWEALRRAMFNEPQDQ